MIEINVRKLEPEDIGRRVKVKSENSVGHEGVIANYTNYAGHVEVVFEDGFRVVLTPEDSLLYDDTVTVTMTSEELRAFIENHPLKKKYDVELKSYERRLEFTVAWLRDDQVCPEYPKELVALENLYEQVKR